MAEPQAPDRRDAGEAKLFTLSEVSQRTGISMPTLQRYKKTYQDRIPSVGSGRKQRYPEHSLPVFADLRTENAGKRGRPRKNAASPAAASAKGAGTAARRGRPAGRKPGRPAAAAAPVRRPGRPAGARRGRPPGRPKAAAAPVAAGRRVGRPAGSGRRPGATSAAGARGARGARGAATGAGGQRLLTLTEISKTTGISYPTLVRYVRLYADRLKHEGKGRARRFYPEAVEAFRTLRSESSRGGRPAGSGKGRRGATGARRGRPPAAAAASGVSDRLEATLRKRLADLEKLQAGVQKRFSDLVKGLQKLL